MQERRTKVIKKLCGYGLLVVMLTGITGCGASSSDAKLSSGTDTAASINTSADLSYNTYETVATEEIEDETVEFENNPETRNVQDTSRKLIKTVDMNVETKDFEGLIPLIENRVSDLGGYIENSDVYNGSSYTSYRDLRWAYLTIRVPQDKLDGFIQDVQGVSNVTNCNRSVEDVTLTYVDLESHKKALLTEQERLLELLEIAENVEDIITIESRLSDVRYEIESMESRLRSYDNKVDYSTVYMNIEEVEILTPVAEESVGQRIVRGFTGSVTDVLDGIKEFFIGFIINLPYLVVWGIIIAVIVMISIKVMRVRRKRKNADTISQNSVIQNIEKAEENDNKSI